MEFKTESVKTANNNRNLFSTVTNEGNFSISIHQKNRIPAGGVFLRLRITSHGSRLIQTPPCTFKIPRFPPTPHTSAHFDEPAAEIYKTPANVLGFLAFYFSSDDLPPSYFSPRERLCPVRFSFIRLFISRPIPNMV